MSDVEAILIGDDSWSPHLKSLVEHGWQCLRERLDTRPKDAVGVIIENPTSPQNGQVLFTTGWVDPGEVLKRFREAKIPLTFAQNLGPGEIRVVAKTTEGEYISLKVPLGSVHVGESTRGSA